MAALPRCMATGATGTRQGAVRGVRRRRPGRGDPGRGGRALINSGRTARRPPGRSFRRRCTTTSSPGWPTMSRIVVSDPQDGHRHRAADLNCPPRQGRRQVSRAPSKAGAWWGEAPTDPARSTGRRSSPTSETSEVYRDEIFGPVLTCGRSPTTTMPLRQANDTAYGLAASRGRGTSTGRSAGDQRRLRVDQRPSRSSPRCRTAGASVRSVGHESVLLRVPDHQARHVRYHRDRRKGLAPTIFAKR